MNNTTYLAVDDNHEPRTCLCLQSCGRLYANEVWSLLDTSLLCVERICCGMMQMHNITYTYTHIHTRVVQHAVDGESLPRVVWCGVLLRVRLSFDLMNCVRCASVQSTCSDTAQLQSDHTLTRRTATGVHTPFQPALHTYTHTLTNQQTDIDVCRMRKLNFRSDVFTFRSCAFHRTAAAPLVRELCVCPVVRLVRFF